MMNSSIIISENMFTFAKKIYGITSLEQIQTTGSYSLAISKLFTNPGQLLKGLKTGSYGRQRLQKKMELSRTDSHC